MRNICNYLNTIRFLRPKQIFYRIYKSKYHMNAKSLDTLFIRPTVFIDGFDNDEEYMKRFAIDDLVEKDEILLLHEKHKIDLESWNIEGEARHLWRFNLHYMEYLIPLAMQYRKTKEKKYRDKIYLLLESWLDCHGDMKGDAWQSYTISLRLINWLIVIDVLDEIVENKKLYDRLVDSIYLQYDYLKQHQEKHLLGNHYFENLKCILVCASCFGEDRELIKYKREFLKQCEEQILSDGMHFERSFMYHKIILEAIMRVMVVIKNNDKDALFVKKLTEIANKMYSVMVGFEGNIERTLLFNDAGNNVAKPAAAFKRACGSIGIFEKNGSSEKCLQDAGYYRYEGFIHEKEDRISRVSLFVDGGVIGPTYMPGHGQCDCLSYELFVNGEPVIVNSGTYQYQDELRQYFRSTAAHNTFLINGVEQSQCWGEHRVAKRIRSIKIEEKDSNFIGRYRDWKGNIAKRCIQWSPCMINISDECINRECVEIKSMIHIAPEWEAEKVSRNRVTVFNKKLGSCFYILVEGGNEICIEGKKPYAKDFGYLEYVDVLAIKGEKVKYSILFEGENEND